MAINPGLRRQVITVYRDSELLYLGREYYLGYNYFRKRLHDAFSKNSGLENEDAIRDAIKRAEYVKKEIEALYYLKKYRALRQRYNQT